MKNDGYLLGFACIFFVSSFFVPFIIGTIFLFLSATIIGFIIGRRTARPAERKKNPFSGGEVDKN